jgi:hypothetical protein
MNFKIMSWKYDKVVGYDSMLKAVEDHEVFEMGQEEDGTFYITSDHGHEYLGLDSKQLRALGEEIILLSEKTSENS